MLPIIPVLAVVGLCYAGKKLMDGLENAAEKAIEKEMKDQKIQENIAEVDFSEVQADKGQNTDPSHSVVEASGDVVVPVNKETEGSVSAEEAIQGIRDLFNARNQSE